MFLLLQIIIFIASLGVVSQLDAAREIVGLGLGSISGELAR